MEEEKMKNLYQESLTDRSLRSFCHKMVISRDLPVFVFIVCHGYYLQVSKTELKC